MKKILFLVVTLLLGLGVGGGAAYATMLLVGPKAPHVASAETAEGDAKQSFVPVDKVLAPLVTADGNLSGYVQFQLSLEVPEDKAEFVTARLPLLLHAINMRTYRTPLAAGPDGMLPNIEEFRKVVEAAAPEAFGSRLVKKVAVTQATPA
jgi:hypothetical protein